MVSLNIPTDTTEVLNHLMTQFSTICPNNVDNNARQININHVDWLYPIKGRF